MQQITTIPYRRISLLMSARGVHAGLCVRGDREVVQRIVYVDHQDPGGLQRDPEHYGGQRSFPDAVMRVFTHHFPFIFYFSVRGDPEQSGQATHRGDRILKTA